MNVYMLSYTSNNNTVTRQEILDYLDTRREVLNWFAAMPFTIFLVSRESSSNLAKLLGARFPNNLTFTIAKVDSKTMDGLINQQVWEFIHYPRSSGRWE